MRYAPLGAPRGFLGKQNTLCDNKRVVKHLSTHRKVWVDNGGVMPALGRLMQEDLGFEAYLDYITSLRSVSPLMERISLKSPKPRSK